MRENPRNAAASEDGKSATPSNCPACRSADVTTTSKVANAASYWRCQKCGEVWNVERLRAASASRFDYRWRG